MEDCVLCENQIIIKCNKNESLSTIENVDSFFFCIVLKGKLVISIYGVKCFLTSPCLICIDDTTEIIVNSHANLTAKSISFSPSFLNKNLTFELIKSEKYKEIIKKFNLYSLDPFIKFNQYYFGILLLDKMFSNNMLQIFELCANELENKPDELWSCRTRSYLIELILMVDSIYLNEIDGKPETISNESIRLNEITVESVLNFIHINYMKKLNIGLLCKSYNTNRTSLSDCFYKYTGTTIKKYINDYRLKVASHMLCFSDLSIEEIALRIGFNYSSNFITEFVKKMQITPTEYRKSEVSNRKIFFEGEFNLKI